MKKIKSNVVIVLIFIIFCLVLTIVFFNSKAILNAIKATRAPADWAFEASSIELNNKIIEKYPQLDPYKTGFVTKSAANAMTRGLCIDEYTTVEEELCKKISGTIKGIENFTNIGFLDLSFNRLSGEIPAAISNLNKLEVLNLSYNQLSGKVPSNIGVEHIKKLILLDLHNNHLSGEVPSLGEPRVE